MWLAPSVPVYILAFSVLWGSLGGWLAIAPTATASYFGTRDYPRCYGVVFLAFGAGASPARSLPGSSGPRPGTTSGCFPACSPPRSSVLWLHSS
jgi:hypothetical protein